MLGGEAAVDAGVVEVGEVVLVLGDELGVGVDEGVIAGGRGVVEEGGRRVLTAGEQVEAAAVVGVAVAGARALGLPLVDVLASRRAGGAQPVGTGQPPSPLVSATTSLSGVSKKTLEPSSERLRVWIVRLPAKRLPPLPILVSLLSVGVADGRGVGRVAGNAGRGPCRLGGGIVAVELQAGTWAIALELQRGPVLS